MRQVATGGSGALWDNTYPPNFIYPCLYLQLQHLNLCNMLIMLLLGILSSKTLLNQGVTTPWLDITPLETGLSAVLEK